MTGLVGRAEKRGLLQRAPNPDDGRAVDVFVTEAGAALIDRARAQVDRELAPRIGELSPAEQRRLQSLLERMRPSR
ncbi:MarR family winged helix-turn-helix transcriptional regulator [Nocardia sp. NPDC020380]|uniref:MarR family winged helix-turn-helix transcriptional regulator n=1 Tax=Nocardia sp. NPDC020380 TaxID=3364309 RepID=UPI00379D8BB1